MRNWVAIPILILFSGFAGAQDLLPSLPDFGSDPLMLTTDSVVLGRGCLMMPGTDLGIACNPALLADSEVKQLRMNMFIDQGFTKVVKQYRLVQDKDSLGLLNDILEDGGSKMSQAATNIWYQQNWWMLSFTPARVRYAVTDNHNPAYPEVAAYIRKDMEIAWSGGFHVESDRHLRVGVTTRYHWSELLHQQFTVLDAIASDGRIIKVGEQSGLLIEPGMAYEFDEELHANIVADLTGLEVLRSGLSQGNAQPMGDIGLTMRPEWDGLRWTFGTQLTFLGDQTLMRRWRFMSLLETEWANFSFNVAMGEIGFGISTAIDSLTLGIGYLSRDFSDKPTWGGDPAQDVMVDIGLRF